MIYSKTHNIKRRKNMKTKINITINESILNHIKEEAKKENRNLSNMIEQMLLQNIRREQQGKA